MIEVGVPISAFASIVLWTQEAKSTFALEDSFTNSCSYIEKASKIIIQHYF